VPGYELPPEPRRSLPLGSYAALERMTGVIGSTDAGVESRFALEQGPFDEDFMDSSNQAPLTKDNGSPPSTSFESTSAMLHTPAVSQSLYAEDTRPGRALALTNEPSDSPRDLQIDSSLGTLGSSSEVPPSALDNAGESLTSSALAPKVTAEGSNFEAASVLSKATSAMPNTSSKGLEGTDASQPSEIEGSKKDHVALPTLSRKTPESPTMSQAQVTEDLDSDVTRTYHDASSTSLETPADSQAPATERSDDSTTRTPSNPSISSPQTSAAAQAPVTGKSITTSTPESHSQSFQAKEEVAEQMVCIRENNGMKLSKKNISINKLGIYLKKRTGWVIGFATSDDFRSFKTLSADNLVKHIQTKRDTSYRYYCFKESHYVELYSEKAKRKQSQGVFLQEVDHQPQDRETAREDQQGLGIETHALDEDIGCKHLTLQKTIWVSILPKELG
jgi:hypothetical protein